MSSRSSKKRGKKTINTRSRKKQETVVSTCDHLNKLLDDSQSENTSTVKQERKKKQDTVSSTSSSENTIASSSSNDDSDEIPKGVSKSTKKYKKKQASLPSQIIEELLKDDNNLQVSKQELSDGDKSASINILSQSSITAPQSQPLSGTNSLSDFHGQYLTDVSTNAKNDFHGAASQSPIAAPPRPFIVLDSKTADVFNNALIPSHNILNTINNTISHVCKNNMVVSVSSPFSEMSIYQLCLWLCANPNILQLANSMNLAVQTPVVHLTPSVFQPIASQPVIQEDNAKAGQDFLEELKCLFLRARNPKKSVFEDLVQQIIKCDLNSAEGIEWLRTANKHFGDYRSKFLDNVETLIKKFKEKRTRSSTIPLQKEEITTFVDESATVHVLNRWLNATNMDELRVQNSIAHLRKFIQSAFAINYTSRDTEKTKTLDELTKSIAVPSRNGKNFASNLRL